MHSAYYRYGNICVLSVVIIKTDDDDDDDDGWVGGWLAGCLSQPVLYQND